METKGIVQRAAGQMIHFGRNDDLIGTVDKDKVEQNRFRSLALLAILFMVQHQLHSNLDKPQVITE